MANILNGFLNNVLQGASNPKGNLGDYQHASRLFVDDGMRLAPKTKFLYHVVFELSDNAQKMVPQLDQRHKQEINMLVKQADLPKFSVQTSTKNMYNRKKNMQTSIEYDPVNITFHDDNMGLTTTLMEAYYRYYFRDGNYNSLGAAAPYAPRNTYQGPQTQNFRYGLDNDHKTPFFNKITIYQMAKHSYLGFTLVNPLITGLTHDQVDSYDNSTPSQNQISVAYEAVFYDQGSTKAGAQGEPAGFGQDHYDNMPSPISLEGGGKLGLGGTIGGALDLYEFIASGGAYNNPLLTILQGAQLLGNVRNLSKEGIRQEGFNILTGALGQATGTNVSGVAQAFFPKNSGNGGGKDLLLAAAGVGIVSAVTSSNNSLKSDPAALGSARQRQAIKNHQLLRGSSAAEAKANYEATKNDPAAMAAIDAQLGL